MTNVERSKYWRKAGIYRIYSIVDSRCYIGSSKNLYRRLNCHYNLLKKGKHTNSRLQQFVNVHGIDNLECEVLLVCKTHELCAFEDEQRTKYDSFREGFDMLEKSYRPSGKKRRRRSKKHSTRKPVR